MSLADSQHELMMRLVSAEDRIAALEVVVSDLEARITALETAQHANPVPFVADADAVTETPRTRRGRKVEP